MLEALNIEEIFEDWQHIQHTIAERSRKPFLEGMKAFDVG